MSARRSNAERSGDTRAALVDAARRQFAQRGYASTTLVDVAESAGVSTGALYHHWRGKAPLMGSVVVAIHQDLCRAIVTSARAHRTRTADPLVSLERASMVFLGRSLDPSVGRVLLIEAPAVLAEHWHELDRQWWHDPTTRLLRRAARAGVVDLTNVDGYATALLGSLTALGRAVVGGSQTPDRAGAVVSALIDNLRIRRATADKS